MDGIAENDADITELAVQLLTASLAPNSVAPSELAELIRSTRSILSEDLGTKAAAPEEDHVPAPSIRKSLAFPDHNLSLIDGKPYKTLTGSANTC